MRRVANCKNCIHEEACAAWIRHGEALYDDFECNVENCPYRAEEVPHGEWLPMYNVDWIYGKEWLTDYICTQCGGLNKKKSPYCPNCGAHMDGGKE